MIPAILYGEGAASVPLVLNKKDIIKILKSETRREHALPGRLRFRGERRHDQGPSDRPDDGRVAPRRPDPDRHGQGDPRRCPGGSRRRSHRRQDRRRVRGFHDPRESRSNVCRRTSPSASPSIFPPFISISPSRSATSRRPRASSSSATRTRSSFSSRCRTRRRSRPSRKRPSPP